MNIGMETSQSDNSITESGKFFKKKAGRKPKATSPTLRKAQNRASQQAFRARKQQYIKELELDYKRLVVEREKYYKKTKQLCKQNDILKCENWYLKGIVLSLQLVCFNSKICVPKHTPHVDDRALQVMAESAPASIAAYIDVNCHYPSPILNDHSTDYSIRSSIPNDDTTSDGSSTAAATHSSDQSDAIKFHHFHQNSAADGSYTTTDTNETIKLQPVLLRHDTVTNNLSAIQALRIRLRLQSALFRENSVLHSITPTPLQLSVPHDPRIDLIPTPHMRDRMIIFQNQFDLDDCLRLLVNEAFFHGGDPTVAGNWELPTSFYEKYWFLTIDYTQERTNKRWQRLKAKPTLDILPTVSSSASLPCQQSPPDNMHNGHPHHHQPIPPVAPTCKVRPSFANDSTQQSSHGSSCDPPSVAVTDVHEFMLQDLDSFCPGQTLGSMQQTNQSQSQPPWMQPFPFDNLG